VTAAAGGDAGQSALLDAFYEALLDDDADKLYDRAPCGYLSTTPDGRIVKVNQTFLTLTGYDRDQLVGQRTFAELLTAGGRIYHETHYAPMLQMQGTARAIALDIVRADGGRLPVLVNAVLERDSTGTPVVVRTAVFDATERREYERELMRAKQRAEESEEHAKTLARTLQQTLIPPVPPQIPGLDVAAAYRPAGTGEEVGGDFYDVFQLADDDWVVTIGDVRGKGVEAAVITALVRYTLRASAVRFRDGRQALQTLNEVLLLDGTDRFCTVALVRLRNDDGRWIANVVSGGHPLPLLWPAGGVPAVFGEPGSLLGVMSDPSFREAETVLQPGDTLMLYTDGVTEGRRGVEFYGSDRLAASVRAHAGSAATVVGGVVTDLLNFQSGLPRDDVAVVAVGLPR
jgi:sigma-B regulation protein RsbU (phosphoserine phosphatase)